MSIFGPLTLIYANTSILSDKLQTKPNIKQQNNQNKLKIITTRPNPDSLAHFSVKAHGAVCPLPRYFSSLLDCDSSRTKFLAWAKHGVVQMRVDVHWFTRYLMIG